MYEAAPVPAITAAVVFAYCVQTGLGRRAKASVAAVIWIYVERYVVRASDAIVTPDRSKSNGELVDGWSAKRGARPSPHASRSCPTAQQIVGEAGAIDM